MEITFKNYKYHKDILNITISPKEIVGVTGKNYKDFLNIFNIINKHTEIKIDGNRLLMKDIDYYKNKIVYIKNLNYLEKNYTIEEYLINEIVTHNLDISNEYKTVLDTLIVVGLDYLDLSTNIKDLTTSEKTLLTISTELLYNAEVLVLDEPYLGLDKINTKIVNIILNKLAEEYDKTIILGLSNVEDVYNYTNYVCLVNNNKLDKYGETEEVYKDIKFLEKHNYSIRNSIKFISLVHDRGINLNYNKDIRDIIKDIYKHV